MHTVRYFRAKKFNWLGLSEQPSLSAKVRRAAGQFLPWSYEDFDWQLTSGVCVLTTRARKLCLSLTWKPSIGPRRCLMCVVPLLVMTGCELNAFLLKRVLWIPPRNALNTCRLCVWVGACSPRALVSAKP